MKVMTILGTRPEIIRLSEVIPLLDRLCDHVLVHTGQNSDPLLSDIFFDELEVRRPDRYLDVGAQTLGRQIGRIIARTEEALLAEQPERVILLGDTNSALSAVIAKRLGIVVYHLEAGNRCYDDRVPEEVNRRVIDHSSDVLMPYTERSARNLISEGIPAERVFVIGNPIFEVLRRHQAQIETSNVMAALGVAAGGYILVTMHREENVDIEDRLRGIVTGLGRLADEYGCLVIVSVHPRTRTMLERFEISADISGVVFSSPFSWFDFIALERNAMVVISDSGTVQEECCIHRVPNVAIRDVTERPETVEVGSTILSGAEPENIVRCVSTALATTRSWARPPEYTVDGVSATVAKIVLGYHPGPRQRASRRIREAQA